MQVICPYCKSQAEYVDTAVIYRGKSYGMAYLCKPCDAYVGVHKGTDLPLGTLANKEDRIWRMKAHAAFDPLWKTGNMKRRDAYSHMQRLMDMSAAEAHISRMTATQCQKLVSLLVVGQPIRRSTDVKISKRTDFSLLDCCAHIPPWEHCAHTAALGVTMSERKA